MNAKDLGDRIQARRKQIGLSQQDLAIALGLDQGKVSLIEKGSRRIDPYEELPKLAKALKCRIDWLYGDESEWLFSGQPIGKSPASIVLRELYPEVEFSKKELQRINQFIRGTVKAHVKWSSDLSKKVGFSIEDNVDTQQY